MNFKKERLLNRGAGFYLYTEPRKDKPITRNAVEASVGKELGRPVVLLFRNNFDSVYRNYVLHLTKLKK